MGGGHQVFHPILAPPNRAAQVARQSRDREFLAIERDLLTEGAAHIGAHHRNLAFRQTQPRSKLAAQRVRDLIADMHVQMRAPVIPIGDAAARLQRHMGVAMERETGLDDAMRLGPARGRIADAQALMRDHVARQAVVDQSGIGREGLGDRGHRRKLVIFDTDTFGGILCEVAIGRDDADHRIAVKADLVDRKRRQLGRLQPFDRRCEAQPRCHLIEIAPGENPHDPRHFSGFGAVDPENARMGVGRTHEAHMQRAGKGEVVEIAPAPRNEAPIFLARQGATDLGEIAAHAASPRIRAAAFSTAATIF